MRTVSIKVDVNDADYRIIKSKVPASDIKLLHSFAEALGKFRPYMRRSRPHIHNFPWGGRYGIEIHRPDLGGKSAWQYYVKSGRMTDEVFTAFEKLVGRRTFHTIIQIKVSGKVIFEKPWPDPVRDKFLRRYRKSQLL